LHANGTYNPIGKIYSVVVINNLGIINENTVTALLMTISYKLFELITIEFAVKIKSEQKLGD
jgi:hypothetical protein